MLCTKCRESYNIVLSDGDLFICEFCNYYDQNKEELIKIYQYTGII
jgi:hypothetical protein